ncbi:hypothetical protein AB3N58_10235 [Leptospira sp. WS60.C2]
MNLKEYLKTLDNKKVKKQLDEILDQFKAQPVGQGYIDIIVKREYIEDFIIKLSSKGFLINALSWWLYLELNEFSKYGYGGPKSKFYSGWYSELPHDFDELNNEEIERYLISMDYNGISYINQHFSNVIFSKETIQYYDSHILKFETDLNLTPGFWIYTPDNWRNSKQ